MKHSIDPPLKLLSPTFVHIIKFEIFSPGLNWVVCDFSILTVMHQPSPATSPATPGKKKKENKGKKGPSLRSFPFFSFWITIPRL
jgi:hypothetical protein